MTSSGETMFSGAEVAAAGSSPGTEACGLEQADTARTAITIMAIKVYIAFFIVNSFFSSLVLQ
jgi:hypothetical protein